MFTLMKHSLWIHITASLTEHYKVVDDYMNYLGIQTAFELKLAGKRYYANFLIPDGLIDDEDLIADGLSKIPCSFDSNGKVLVQ